MSEQVLSCNRCGQVLKYNYCRTCDDSKTSAVAAAVAAEREACAKMMAQLASEYDKLACGAVSVRARNTYTTTAIAYANAARLLRARGKESDYE